MSEIVQIASKFNTSGGQTVTAVFPRPLTAGNPILVSVVAIDTGAAVDTDGDGAPFITLADTQGNTFRNEAVSCRIFGDGANNISLLCGGYTTWGNPVPGGDDSVTFIFAPISVPENCLVGLVAYELSDPGNRFAGGVNDTACSPAVSATFPIASNFQGGLNYASPADPAAGTLFVVAGAALTTDGSDLASGAATDGDPAFILGGASAVTLNGKKITIGAQICASPQTFANAQKYSNGFAGVGSGAIVSGAGAGYMVPLLNAPSTDFTIGGNCGVAGALVSYSGAASGTVLADASGDYVIGSAVDGDYTITPSLAGYTFSPASQSVTVNGSDIADVNFTATPAPVLTNWLCGMDRLKSRLRISVSETANEATLAEILSDISAECRAWTGNDFTYQTLTDELYDASGDELALRHFPVDPSQPIVMLAKTFWGTFETWAAQWYSVDPVTGVLTLTRRYKFPDYRQNIMMTYTGGYPLTTDSLNNSFVNVPGDLQESVAAFGKATWKYRQDEIDVANYEVARSQAERVWARYAR